ncbi:MAG TPA: hypothetical protein VHP11_13095, partial [Tepidisphaeraceae bacterium]|nr:hypothetical protein [Tepidisphaeraceae bacterium]
MGMVVHWQELPEVGRVQGQGHMSSTDPNAISSPAVRVPRRYFWLKRIAGGYVLFLAGVALLSYVASHLAQSRLDGEIQKIRARGEPVLIEDFVEPAIPDEENAAFYLKRAAKAFEKMSNEQVDDFNNLPTKLPWSPADAALMEKLTARYAHALPDVRAARGKTGVNWGMQLKSPAITVLLPWLTPQRTLSQYLRAAALHAHQQGDDAAAVELLRDQLMIGRTVDRSPFLISHLVALSNSSQAATAALAIAPDLRVEHPDTPAPAGTKPASRQQVRALLDELSDEQSARAAVMRAMWGERLFQLDSALCIANGRLDFNFNEPSGPDQPQGSSSTTRQLTIRFVRPLALAEARNTLDWSSQAAEAFAQDSLSAASAQIPAIKPRLSSPLMSMLLPALNAAATGLPSYFCHPR